MPMLPKVFYRFDWIPFKIPKSILAEIENKNAVEFIWNQAKGSRGAKPLLKKKNTGGYTVLKTLQSKNHQPSVITALIQIHKPIE